MSGQNELRAGHILSEVLDGRVVRRDVPGAPAGTHDFDLKFDDDRTIAVEVTVSTDPKIVEFWHALHDRSWDAPQLRHSWMLNVTPPAHVQTLRSKVEPLLHSLEQVDRRKFGLGRGPKTPEIEELHRLGVKSGDVLESTLPPSIYIYSTGAGFASTKAVREAVEREAMKQDNRSKLGRAKADERHLFVWIDTLNTPAAAAMGFMDISPPTGCTLPPEVDAVWIAFPTQADDSGNIVDVQLWRCDQLNGWQKVRGTEKS